MWWAGGLPAEHSPRPLPSHLSFQGLCLLHLHRSACWGPALDTLQARPSPELCPEQAPPVPADSSQSCSCTRALQSSTEARPHLWGSLGPTTEPKRPASSCSPVALHSVWLLLSVLRGRHPSPSSTLSPEPLRLLPLPTEPLRPRAGRTCLLFPPTRGPAPLELTELRPSVI